MLKTKLRSNARSSICWNTASHSQPASPGAEGKVGQGQGSRLNDQGNCGGLDVGILQPWGGRDRGSSGRGAGRGLQGLLPDGVDKSPQCGRSPCYLRMEEGWECILPSRYSWSSSCISASCCSCPYLLWAVPYHLGLSSSSRGLQRAWTSWWPRPRGGGGQKLGGWPGWPLARGEGQGQGSHAPVRGQGSKSYT